MISSLALLILLESLILMILEQMLRLWVLSKSLRNKDFGAIITPADYDYCCFCFAFVLSIAFMKRTKLGKAMRAVSDNKDVAQICGISSENIYAWSFIIGSAIAGVAGILIGLEQNLDPAMGTDLMIKGFTAAIIGGIGSIPGAILGAFLLGLAENFGIWYLPSGYKDAIAFVLLFLFLLLRPKGILGVKREGEKE